VLSPLPIRLAALAVMLGAAVASIWIIDGHVMATSRRIGSAPPEASRETTSDSDGRSRGEADVSPTVESGSRRK